MGGAGKTAIADRFLQVLPGVMPDTPQIPKDKSLPTPNSTFVFSFYDAPNPEAFLEALHRWLAGSPNVEAQVSFSQLIFMMQNAVPGLIILDGLEKVQEDGTRGVFGRLASPNLRDFINRLASGYLPNLSVLITTRFPLADLQETQPQFFKSIPIEEIDLATGIRLLRQRGVVGNDLELERIVKECGRHALTMDLAGGYIKEYGNGDPDTPLALGTAAELEQAIAQEQDPTKRNVLKQGFRFARVAQRYKAAMVKNDETAIVLLERICLFRLGVEATTLATIFTGDRAKKVSGSALARLDARQLRQKLDWLVRMRIIEKSAVKSRNSGETRILYNIHPAVRDGFFRGIGQGIASASHEAIRTGLEVSLGDAPGENPSDPATLDLLEEIVYHAIASGRVQEAWDIYENRIGQYENLGWRLGAYERGERICRAFSGGQLPENVTALLRAPNQSELEPLPCIDLTENDQAIFICGWGLYLKNLGRLDDAARCYEAHNEMQIRQENWKNASIGNQNLSEEWLLVGQLRFALSAASESLRLADQANDAGKQLAGFSWAEAFAFSGKVKTQQGKLLGAIRDFTSALEKQKMDESKECLYSLRGIQHTQLLARLGRHDEVQQLTEMNLKVMNEIWPNGDSWTPKCHLILADLSLQLNQVLSSRHWYEAAHSWSLARDSKEELCWADQIRAQIALTKLRSQESGIRAKQSKPLHQAAQAAIDKGLKIAP